MLYSLTGLSCLLAHPRGLFLHFRRLHFLVTGFSLSIKPLLPLVIDRRQIGRSSKDTLSLDRPGFGGITHRGNLDWTSLLGIGDGEDQVDLACQHGQRIE